MTIKLITCAGDEIINPDFQQLKFLVRTGESEYWEGGSGEALIEYNDGQKSSKLYIMMSEGYGFYLEYCNNKAYVPVTNDCFEDIAKVYVGGDPVPVPRAFFLSEEETERQVEEFLNTGEVNHNVKWVEKDKTGWNYGEDPNEKEYKGAACKSIEELTKRHSKVKRKWMKW
ncbi:MAG TPA: hypothetical protein VF941_19510 [Clostridia bacterium]